MKRTTIQTGAALIAGSLLLAACSSGEGAGSDSDSDGILTIASGQDTLPQLDPAMATFQWERVLYPLLWDGLTEINPEGEVVEGLAESWVANEEFTEWTFQIREGVTFSNGRELTVEDIVWNAERVISENNASIANQYLAAVSEVEAVSDSEVRFLLSEPDSVLPRGLTAMRIIDPDSEDTINTEPVGTGPFVVEEFVPDQSLTMTRNEDYWGEEPGVAGIEIAIPNDTAAAVTALRTGDVQVLWNLPTADAAPLEEDPNVALIQPDDSTRLNYLSLDTSTPPFDDPRARQALSLAIDRQGAVDVGYAGYGEAAITNEIAPTGHWSIEAANLEAQEPNLERAAELFEEAGVEEGDTLVWWGGSGKPDRDRVAQLLQENLAEIGINLEIQNREAGTWVDKFVPVGSEYPGHIVPNAGGDLNDPAFIYSRVENGRCECNWSSDELDELAAEGRQSDDEAERAEIYSRVQEIVTEELPIIVTLHPPMLVATQSEVSGVWVAPSGDLRVDDAVLSTE